MRCEAQHLCRPTRVFLFIFFITRRTHKKLSFCVSMISRTENQKIFNQTLSENIKIESIPFVFLSLLRGFVRLQIALQKGEFLSGHCFFSLFEIIKTKTRQEVRGHSPWTTDFVINSCEYS